MESKPDYYKTLGVSRDASADDVKKAFRKLARTHHPDAGGDEARFKEINEAYEVLSDDKKRQMYDQFGTAEANGIPGGWGNVGDMFGGTVGWAEILESLRQGGGLGFDGFGGFGGFGGTARGPVARKGRDTNVTLSVTFDEAFKGAEKRVTVRVPGRSDKETLSVKVPAGAIDGGRLRFKGRGMPGENGGAAGDLFITTKIQSHEYFHRDGADVHIDVPISISEAALGASVVVPVPEGGRVRVKVPAGTQDGAVLTLKGKGAPRVKGSGSGDLKIKVGVRVPTELSDKQRSALEALAAAETKGIRSWE